VGGVEGDRHEQGLNGHGPFGHRDAAASRRDDLRVPGDLERLSYESALRHLEVQERVVGELRARTGLLLAASSLAISFLGSPAAEAGRPVVVLLAVVAFVVSIGASVFVLLPGRRLVFAVVGADVYEGLYAVREDGDELHRRLAYDLTRLARSNERRVSRLLDAYEVATVALTAEIVLLLAAFAGTLL
jgi:hypothetical protein